MGPLLEVRDVAKSYGPVVALRSVDLTVGAGEIHALLGANGAGKSTLVKILSGVIEQDRGGIEVQGRPVRIARPSDARANGLATVFQEPALIPDLTVTENLRLSGTSPDDTGEWLARMGLGSVDFGELVRDLPLPTLRMLDLARSLAGDPLLLLLDEITAALPSDLAVKAFDVMNEWRERGRSVLFISHRLAEVLAHCDKTTVLRDGRDVAAFVPGEGGERRLVKEMLGEVAQGASVTAGRAKGDRERKTVSFEARDLVVGTSLRGVSLQVNAGEILGVTALEGQGQDVLFRVMAGIRKPDSGELLVEGKRLEARSPFDAIRLGVVLVPADRRDALLPQRSVHENLAVPLYNRPGQWSLIDTGGEHNKVSQTIERLSIDTRAQGQVRRLSGGNQQKVAIGRWLTAGFKTLLCFDPTRGIDIGTKRQIYDLLNGLAAEGIAVIVYTSELQEVPLVCDRVLVMYDGRVVDEQDASSADEASLLSAAHGLGREEIA